MMQLCNPVLVNCLYLQEHEAKMLRGSGEENAESPEIKYKNQGRSKEFSETVKETTVQ